MTLINYFQWITKKIRLCIKYIQRERLKIKSKINTNVAFFTKKCKAKEFGRKCGKPISSNNNGGYCKDCWFEITD